MGGGRFWYMPEAGTLRDALASAMWSGKHPGMDERLDDGTTDIDTLDAFEYANRHQIKIEAALLQILRAMLWVGKVLTGAPIDENAAVTINFDDSYISDAETRRQRDKDDALNGFVPKYVYNMEWRGMSEDDAKRAVKEAANETDGSETLGFGGDG